MDLTLKKKTFKQRIKVHAHPMEVYKAFVDAKIHSTFTGSKATGKAKVGGKFTAWDGYISGKFMELQKGKGVVQEWITTDFPEGYPPSRLDLTFVEVEGGTEILMVHSDVPAEQVQELKEGWDEFYWRPLKEYFKRLHGKQE